LQKLFDKLIPWRVQWKGVMVESLIFLGAYILWVILRPVQSPSRWLVGSLSILAPAVTASILVFRFLPQISILYRRAWKFFGWGLLCWSLGMAVRKFQELGSVTQTTSVLIAHAMSFLVYPLLFCALLFHPFENRYSPSRSRFLLDAIISSGVVATLCWLILARPPSSMSLSDFILFLYPIADLILLMILINMLLANPQARRTLFLWGLGLSAFLVSDYVYSLLTSVGGYRTGGLESLGWTIGGLVFGVGVVFSAGLQEVQEGRTNSNADLGIQIQNILPITLVLALGWFVLGDWRLRGVLSVPGIWASGFLTIVLIARMGLQAGEVELHKYWQLFASLAEPAFICDGNGKILLGNPALAKVLGDREEKQVLGKNLASIFDEQTFPADFLEKATKQAYSMEVFLRPHHTPYLLSLSPIVSETRKVVLAGAAHDLSDQKHQQAITQKALDELRVVHQKLAEFNTELEKKVEERTHTLGEAYQQLEEQNKILQSLDQIKSDFVSMVSHELRTPLTSLNGGVELLLSRKGRKTEDISTLLLMKNEVQRLTIFVENILNLSAMEAGRINVHTLPLSLQEILEEVLSHFSTTAGSEWIQIDLPEDLPNVEADEALLMSVFHHLVDNALKYAPQTPVVIGATLEGARVRVQVTDGGPGIPADKRSLLFQRFQRLEAKDSQSVYGHGLGLYFSQQMLVAMKSELAYEEPPEGGARFFFHLKVPI
jgi:PAS domain S-box-containing protein